MKLLPLLLLLNRLALLPVALQPWVREHQVLVVLHHLQVTYLLKVNLLAKVTDEVMMRGKVKDVVVVVVEAVVGVVVVVVEVVVIMAHQLFFQAIGRLKL